MENKYYTPTIEEFHVGFEFERFIPKSNTTEEECWEKLPMSVNYLTLGELDEEITENEIRVKYLDKEDIGSLGFTHLPKKSLKGLTERFIIEGLYRRLNKEYDAMWWNVYLEYAPDIKRVIIKGDISSGEYNEKFFEGVIKNKSELKVLLKQLGIIES